MSIVAQLEVDIVAVHHITRTHSAVFNSVEITTSHSPGKVSEFRDTVIIHPM